MERIVISLLVGILCVAGFPTDHRDEEVAPYGMVPPGNLDNHYWDKYPPAPPTNSGGKPSPPGGNMFVESRGGGEQTPDGNAMFRTRREANPQHHHHGGYHHGGGHHGGGHHGGYHQPSYGHGHHNTGHHNYGHGHGHGHHHGR